MENFKYLGKPLGAYTLQQLKNILSGLEASLAVRKQAAKHDKFNKYKQIGNRKIPKMEFPGPNSAFYKLKEAIETEIKDRK